MDKRTKEYKRLKDVYKFNYDMYNKTCETMKSAGIDTYSYKSAQSSNAKAANYLYGVEDALKGLGNFNLIDDLRS